MHVDRVKRSAFTSKVNGDKILDFLRSNGIEYVDRGPDVAKDNVNIKCPFCGDEDTGEHMGINLETGYYGCWRNTNHRGRDVAFLLKVITGISLISVRRQIGSLTVLSSDDITYMYDVLNNTERNQVEESRPIGGVEHLKLLKSFKPLWKYNYSCKPYYKYLENRGFNNISELTYVYRLHYCMYGDWNYRIIFPIYYKRKLVTWVGRSIHKDETMHYRDLSVPESVRHAKFCISEYDYVSTGGRNLYIVEGLMDSTKMNWYLRNSDKATCLFTNSMTTEQRDILWKIGKKFDTVIVLLDNDATGNALTVQSQLRPVLKNVFIRSVQDRYGDPGALPGCNIQRGIL